MQDRFNILAGTLGQQDTIHGVANSGVFFFAIHRFFLVEDGGDTIRCGVGGVVDLRIAGGGLGVLLTLCGRIFCCVKGFVHLVHKLVGFAAAVCVGFRVILRQSCKTQGIGAVLGKPLGFGIGCWRCADHQTIVRQCNIQIEMLKLACGGVLIVPCFCHEHITGVQVVFERDVAVNRSVLQFFLIIFRCRGGITHIVTDSQFGYHQVVLDLLDTIVTVIPLITACDDHIVILVTCITVGFVEVRNRPEVLTGI